jgi:transposase-like protein
MSHSRRVNREKWRQIIDDQRACGQAIAAFCRDHQIGQASFFAWRRRLSARQDSPLPPRFIEVTPPMDRQAVADAPAIEVGLSGRCRLLVRRGFDHDLLIELIQTLECLP